jgi:hypothetical protein
MARRGIPRRQQLTPRQLPGARLVVMAVHHERRRPDFGAVPANRISGQLAVAQMSRQTRHVPSASMR